MFARTAQAAGAVAAYAWLAGGSPSTQRAEVMVLSYLLLVFLGRAREVWSALALAEGAESYEVEYRMLHKDGHSVPILQRAFIQRDEAGRPARISSARARCSGTVTSMSAGRRCAKVPTSRAVPQAEGWPVSENGLLPGSLILPVSRCTL